MSEQQYDGAGQGYVPARNGLAVVAMVMGIVGLMLSLVVVGVVLGVAALIMGIVAVSRGTRKGAAITGIVTGALSLPVAFLAMMVLAVLLPGLTAARRTAREVQAMANMRALDTAVTIYAASYNDRYPDHLAGAMQYVGSGVAGSGMANKVIKDPRWGGAAVTLPPANDMAAMKAALDAECDFYYAGAGLKQGKVAHQSEIILFYDKDIDPRGHRLVGFMDGHVERFDRGSAALQRVIEATNKERAAQKLGPLPAGLAGPVEGVGVER